MPELKEQLEKLNAEISDMDASLRAFMAAEKPEQGIFHAGDIHRLRQAKMQKRLEMEYCQARIRFLQSEGAGRLQ
jgi:hypothetical protein